MKTGSCAGLAYRTEGQVSHVSVPLFF
ncbi:hypothetical protein B14911_13302 [Bacillus sp. NRRL B-14911]|nr:hypothetical protein B14911_13302 [Bacillus sp. NRRL B-14911]